jgi:hypothetical protein
MKNYGRWNLSLMSVGNTAVASHSRACPRCQSAVFSVSRRLSDLFVSLFIPLRRYRCISMKCSWEGTLRERKTRLPETLRAAPRLGSAPASAPPVRIRPVALTQKTSG